MLDGHTQPNGAQNETPPVEFTFEDQTVRTITKDGEIWFIAADVCRALEIKDTSQAVERLDNDEKGTCKIRTLGGEQSLLSVNEFGLYNLILRSNKAEAKRFQRWVTHEVLPSIRNTGKYEAKQQDDDPQIEINIDAIRFPRPRVGRYVLTVLPNGEYHFFKTTFDSILVEDDHLNLKLLALSLNTIKVFWQKTRVLLSLFDKVVPEHAPLLRDLEVAIDNGAVIADRVLHNFAESNAEPASTHSMRG
ncbi:Bro-N domain-containing protein (plasmid) [Methylocapsa polymorpha]|uniref:Bro-N domain-containing protein n=1 Tax=Methylocapsa polymorpha TaxID=3080828 RepID=A0ABZ0HWV4_9HYPH|nr:Bro-N domain-containing protein [Methylocapsa sp. RX1]WOJ91747.1 Bro-N domain-containing protein [Methylocapsa sp. RX1]